MYIYDAVFLKYAFMGTIKDFEELEIWNLSRELVGLIYKDFINCKDFAFKDQICSAGISIMNNISEGFGRNSDAEFRHFLNISKGSSAEVKSMYYIAEDLYYIAADNAEDRRKLCQKIINGTSLLMKYLRSSR